MDVDPQIPPRQMLAPASADAGPDEFLISSARPMKARTYTPLDPQATNPRNTFTGAHCVDFGRYLQNTGVYDSDGENLPTWAGVTEFLVGIPNFQIHPTRSSQLLWFCPCAPGVYYDSQTACEAVPPCTPGLGGCLEKCGGFTGVCLSVKVKIPYTGPTKVSVLTWKPPSATPGCRKAISTFNAAVAAHEQHHVHDAEAILAKAQKQPPKTFKACGHDPTEAKNNLHRTISTFVQSEVDRLGKAYLDSVIAFHKTPAGQPIVMDCAAC
jgi:hypothetical protein